MGLFTSSPPVDETLARKIIANDQAVRRSTEKALAKNQLSLPALLEVDEEVHVIAKDENNSAPFPSDILVVTSRRLLRVKRGKLNYPAIPLHEIAETTIGSRDFGAGVILYVVIVRTNTGKLYANQDPRAHDPAHRLSISFQAPQDAQMFCAIVDKLMQTSTK